VQRLHELNWIEGRAIAIEYRRARFTLLGGTVAWPFAARARQHLRRIGVVMAYTESDPNGQMSPQ